MHIHREKQLNYTQEQVFFVINDIESYQQHLPWCSQSKILWANPPLLEGLIEIKFGLLRYQFTTINEVEKPKSIKMKLSSGPFKTLSGLWLIQQNDESSTTLIFDINFEFNNSLLSGAFSVFFEMVCYKLIESFEQRLKTLYPFLDPAKESNIL